jgi:phage shock protein E
MKNKKIIISIAVVVVAALAVFVYSSVSKDNNNQQVEEQQVLGESLDAQKNIAAEQAAMEEVYLDVRTLEEWDDGHIKGAVFHELKLLEEGKMPDLDKDQAVAVYCRSGRRAEEAKAIMEKNGFTKVRNAGGLSELEGNGAKVCKTTDAQCDL